MRIRFTCAAASGVTDRIHSGPGSTSRVDSEHRLENSASIIAKVAKMWKADHSSGVPNASHRVEPLGEPG